MEDITDCKAVLRDVENVKQLYVNLKDRITNQILTIERDYISKSKTLVIEASIVFISTMEERQIITALHRNLIEKQKTVLMGKALEVVGNFTKQALKDSSGDKEWLDYFK